MKVWIFSTEAPYTSCSITAGVSFGTIEREWVSSSHHVAEGFANIIEYIGIDRVGEANAVPRAFKSVMLNDIVNAICIAHRHMIQCFILSLFRGDKAPWHMSFIFGTGIHLVEKEWKTLRFATFAICINSKCSTFVARVSMRIVPMISHRYNPLTLWTEHVNNVWMELYCDVQDGLSEIIEFFGG